MHIHHHPLLFVNYLWPSWKWPKITNSRRVTDCSEETLSETMVGLLSSTSSVPHLFLLSSFPIVVYFFRRLFIPSPFRFVVFSFPRLFLSPSLINYFQNPIMHWQWWWWRWWWWCWWCIFENYVLRAVFELFSRLHGPFFSKNPLRHNFDGKIPNPFAMA